MNAPVRQDLKRRWIEWRNRMIGDPGFQRWAARFLLTRPVARARSRALFDLVAGFTYSQTLLACVESGLLERLSKGPTNTDHVAIKLDLPRDKAERLLRAAAALELAEPVGDSWMLGAAGAALLGTRGITDMIRHHRLLYADLADPLALLRRGGGSLATFWGYGAGNAEAAEAYSRLMAASQAMVCEQVLSAVRFSPGERVLDVGGGKGGFARALAERTGAKPVVFDLPAVAERTIADGVEAIGGDFTRDALPGGFDTLMLVRVLHDHDDEPAQALLERARFALPPGGRLIIAEPMAGTPGAGPMGDAYFGLYLLAMGSGRPRRFDEIATMVRRAGFAQPREPAVALPLITRVVEVRVKMD